MPIEDFASDAVWVAEDVRRRCLSRELARFTFEFPGECARAAARALMASGFYCLRTKQSANTLTVEAPSDQIPCAVGICLEHEGLYVRPSLWLS